MRLNMVRFLEMGVIAHIHATSKLRALRTFYALSVRAHDGMPVRNGAR